MIYRWKIYFFGWYSNEVVLKLSVCFCVCTTWRILLSLKWTWFPLWFFLFDFYFVISREKKRIFFPYLYLDLTLLTFLLSFLSFSPALRRKKKKKSNMFVVYLKKGLWVLREFFIWVQYRSYFFFFFSEGHSLMWGPLHTYILAEFTLIWLIKTLITCCEL